MTPSKDFITAVIACLEQGLPTIKFNTLIYNELERAKTYKELNILQQNIIKTLVELNSDLKDKGQHLNELTDLRNPVYHCFSELQIAILLKEFNITDNRKQAQAKILINSFFDDFGNPEETSTIFYPALFDFLKALQSLQETKE